MAGFLVRALDLPSATKDYFGDDETSAHEDDINRMAEAGITTGCAPDLFCPKATVRRQEMASFLVRALGLPPATADYFSDDEDSTHEAAINSLAESGIASGCAVDRFCPLRTTYRGPMVAFLYRALGEDMRDEAQRLPLTHRHSSRSSRNCASPSAQRVVLSGRPASITRSRIQWKMTFPSLSARVL